MPDPAKQRAVVALQPSVEATDDLPLEAAQELLGVGGAGRWRPHSRIGSWRPVVMRSRSATSGSGTVARMRSMMSSGVTLSPSAS